MLALIRHYEQFQSTLSMRRATRPIRKTHHTWNISIHALHEESDAPSACGSGVPASFQSTLSMRRATKRCQAKHQADRFQSTLSMRRATDPLQQLEAMVTISIHALHEESDNRFSSSMVSFLEFQSTLSMRRATGRVVSGFDESGISIHALHEESDPPS